MSRYPYAESFPFGGPSGTGGRVNRDGGQCLNIYLDSDSNKVQFTASGSSDDWCKGNERPMNGIFNLPLEVAREFLETTLKNLPAKPRVPVKVLKDLSDDDWVELENGNFRALWGYSSLAAAREAWSAGVGEGMSLLEVAESYGIKDVRTELV